MFEAQRLHSLEEVFSPWFPRGGDSVRASMELLDISKSGTSGAITLKLEVYTKNTEDPGNPASALSGEISLTAEGIGTTEWEANLKELVRYKYTVSQPTSSDAQDSVLFRVLPPVWFDAVNAT